MRKRRRLGAAAAQLGLLDDEPQAVLGDAEAAHGIGRGVLAGRFTVGPPCSGLGVGALRIGRTAGDGRGGEHEHERAREHEEAERRAHAATS